MAPTWNTSWLVPLSMIAQHTEISPAMALERIDAPLLICSASGQIEGATPEALRLFARMGCHIASSLPPSLWRELGQASPGEAVTWRPENESGSLLGCTHYRAGSSVLVVMKEISGQQAELSRKLHRQRLEAMGRLTASVAHELRNAVASIVYCADFLRVAGDRADRQAVGETTEEILVACQSLRHAVDSLLDYSRPDTAPTALDLAATINKAARFVRTIHSASRHRIDVEVAPGAEWIRGYALSVEQILVNLFLNAVEASDSTVVIRVTATEYRRPEGAEDRATIRVIVEDDGPGIPSGAAASIFDPFFTTRVGGTGLGLVNAREAAEAMGGRLTLEPLTTGAGARFCLLLPKATP